MDWLLESPKRRKSVAKRNDEPKPKKRRGRPSVADEFPSVVDTARYFIESNGFKAHRRRAEDIGTCGSSIPDIKSHLFHNVPGLKENRPNLGLYISNYLYIIYVTGFTKMGIMLQN